MLASAPRWKTATIANLNMRHPLGQRVWTRTEQIKLMKRVLEHVTGATVPHPEKYIIQYETAYEQQQPQQHQDKSHERKVKQIRYKHVPDINTMKEDPVIQRLPYQMDWDKIDWKWVAKDMPFRCAVNCKMMFRWMVCHHVFEIPGDRIQQRMPGTSLMKWTRTVLEHLPGEPRSLDTQEVRQVVAPGSTSQTLPDAALFCSPLARRDLEWNRDEEFRLMKAYDLYANPVRHRARQLQRDPSLMDKPHLQRTFVFKRDIDNC